MKKRIVERFDARSALSPSAPETVLEEAEAAIMQEYRWGNLTLLGVANHLRRAGFRLEVATEKANALARSPREEGDGWQDEATAPLGEYVLARPRGRHPATGQPFVPSVLRREAHYNGSGSLAWFAGDNDIDEVHLQCPDPGGSPWPEYGVEWHPLPASPKGGPVS